MRFKRFWFRRFKRFRGFDSSDADAPNLLNQMNPLNQNLLNPVNLLNLLNLLNRYCVGRSSCLNVNVFTSRNIGVPGGSLVGSRKSVSNDQARSPRV
jgi:hypothetical protein